MSNTRTRSQSAGTAARSTGLRTSSTIDFGPKGGRRALSVVATHLGPDHGRKLIAYVPVRRRPATSAPSDVPKKASSRRTQSSATVGTLAGTSTAGGTNSVGTCWMVARARVPVDRAHLERRRVLRLAAARLVARPERVGRGRARRTLCTWRDHRGRIPRASPGSEGARTPRARTMMGRGRGAVSPTPSHRLLWGVVINGAALAAWAAEASDRQRARGRPRCSDAQTPFVRRTS
jgi:hypothetical protein